MQIDNSIIKCRCAGSQVKFPHAGKFLSLHSGNLLSVLQEILPPAKQGSIIMTAQTFNIQHVEFVFWKNINNFAQAGDRSSRENIFFYPWVALMLLLGADVM